MAIVVLLVLVLLVRELNPGLAYHMHRRISTGLSLTGRHGLNLTIKKQYKHIFDIGFLLLLIYFKFTVYNDFTLSFQILIMSDQFSSDRTLCPVT